MPERDWSYEVVRLGSEDYPPALGRISFPPAALYVQGELVRDAARVAIVGSRRPTAAGRIAAERLAAGLAGCGLTVVSGLARGIDAAAHRAALEAGGRTEAVLGSGLDVVYPPEHRHLADAIASHGCLMTEFSPGTPPLRWHFPQRNRIIAGLCLGVIIVEGDERSGALSTAAHALDQGREVMAVPGNVLSPVSRAPNRLIREGAALVESAEDVLETLRLPLAAPLRREVVAPEGAAKVVWGSVGVEPTHIDEIAERTGLSPARVGALLLDLELRGLVRQLPGKQFIRV